MTEPYVNYYMAKFALMRIKKPLKLISSILSSAYFPPNKMSVNI